MQKRGTDFRGLSLSWGEGTGPAAQAEGLASRRPHICDLRTCEQTRALVGMRWKGFSGCSGEMGRKSSAERGSGEGWARSEEGSEV